MIDSTTPLEPQANRFTLTDSEGRTAIVFFPKGEFAVSETQVPLPQLTYRGQEGTFTFIGDEITQQSSRLGNLITVILQTRVETGSLEFTLVLPAIYLAGQTERDFTTIGIKTKGQEYTLQPAGAGLTYNGFALRGVAEVVNLPEPR